MEKYHDFEPNFNIVEIFESLQGEGASIRECQVFCTIW